MSGDVTRATGGANLNLRHVIARRRRRWDRMQMRRREVGAH